MKLTVSSKNGVKLYSNLLSSESEYYSDHKMRHPADILRQSIEKLNLALDDFLTIGLKHDFDPRKDKAICDYVLELHAFYDKLLLIIKGLSPATENDNSDVTIWLKENNPEQFNQFKDATSKSHNLIKAAANAIKHDTHSLDYLQVTNHKNNVVKGFYFSNIVGEEELVGPKEKIHKPYKGASTAFSYDFFTRMTTGYVANCIYHLNRIFFEKKRPKPEKFDILHLFFNKVKGTSCLLFPDEYQSDIALFKINGNSIEIKYPARMAKDKNKDFIMQVRPLFKFNERTGQAHNQWPYFKLLNN